MSDMEVMMLEVAAARVWQVPEFKPEEDLIPFIL